jgi:hypothetical protein
VRTSGGRVLLGARSRRRRRPRLGVRRARVAPHLPTAAWSRPQHCHGQSPASRSRPDVVVSGNRGGGNAKWRLCGGRRIESERAFSSSTQYSRVWFGSSTCRCADASAPTRRVRARARACVRVCYGIACQRLARSAVCSAPPSALARRVRIHSFIHSGCDGVAGGGRL